MRKGQRQGLDDECAEEQQRDQPVAESAQTGKVQEVQDKPEGLVEQQEEGEEENEVEEVEKEGVNEGNGYLHCYLCLDLSLFLSFLYEGQDEEGLN